MQSVIIVFNSFKAFELDKIISGTVFSANEPDWVCFRTGGLFPVGVPDVEVFDSRRRGSISNAICDVITSLITPSSVSLKYSGISLNLNLFR